jgi:branched-chain amino acid transport system permease protein
MDYGFYIAVIICIWVMLAISQNLVLGYTGLFSLCQGAFFGIGAYTSAIMYLHFGSNIFVSGFIGAFITSFMGLVIAVPSLRLKGDYFFIATLALQIIIFNLFLCWEPVTKGPLGIYGVLRPKIFGLSLNGNISFLLFTLIFVFLCYFFSNRLCKASFGLSLKAIREDEVGAEAVGKNILKFKILIFMFSAIWASVAGTLYVYFIGAVDPFAFTLEESIFILSIAIVGGMGNLKGSVLGAVVLIALPELLKFAAMPESIAHQARNLIYGICLILFMMFRPQGLIGEYRIDESPSQK